MKTFIYWNGVERKEEVDGLPLYLTVDCCVFNDVSCSLVGAVSQSSGHFKQSMMSESKEPLLRLAMRLAERTMYFLLLILVTFWLKFSVSIKRTYSSFRKETHRKRCSS
jgi:hypothetical protein